MEFEGEDSDKPKGKSASSKQNEKLYEVDGMLNTKMKRAEKKRRKKASKQGASGEAMDDDDYDFKVDYKREGSGMTVDEDEDGDDDDEIKAEVPMAGVEFDD